MKKINAGNLFAGMRSSSVIAGLFIVLIVSIVLLFANFAYLNTQSNHDKQYIGHAGELRVLSQRIAKNATEAAAGKGEAFKLLKDARNDFEKRWNILVNGDESTSLPPSPEAVKPQMDVVQQDWDGLRKNADSILASEQTVLSLHQVASTLAETIPQLQVEYEEVVDILLENGAPADQVAVAQRQSLLAERILGSVNKVLAGDENSVQAADSFGRDASLFGRVLKGMQEGNAAMSISKVTNAEAVDRLNEIAELFEFVSGSVDEILETSPDLFQVREAANNIFSVSQTLLDKASQLADGFENLAGGRSINLFAGYALGALALASIILIGLVMVRETNRRLAETAEKNDRNQAATLLDRLTVQETRFFRHPPSFELLERYLGERLRREGMPRPWALWSVGCSSGEEPYSLAMCAAQVLRGQEREDFFGVTGTDISLHALQRARQANYPARKLEQLEAGLVERYCERQADGSFSVKTILTERVCCARLNVLDLAKAPWSGMDVIFCQNLLIYFRRWRRREILNRLAERLAPGGLLVIGVGEVVDWSHPELEPVADERVLAFTRKGYSGT